MRKISSSRRLLHRILFYFAALIVLMLAVCGINYGSAYNAILANAREKIAASLEFSVSSIDDAIWSIQNVCLSVFQNVSMRTAMTKLEDQTLSSQEYSAIKNQLAIAQNLLSGKISNLVFYYDTQSLISASDGGKTQQDWYFNHVRTYENYDLAFWHGLLNGKAHVALLDATRVYERSSTVDEVVPVVIANPIMGIPAVLLADFPTSAIARTLRANAYAQDTAFAVWNDRGVLIYSNYREPDALQQMHGVGKLTDAQGNAYACVHYESTMYGWHYTALVPAATLMNEVRSVLYMILISCGLALGCACAVTIYATRKLYEPMKLMLSLVDDDEDFQHHNALKSLSHKLGQLVENRDSERETVEQFAQAYLDYSFQSLLQGEPVRAEGLFFEQLRRRVHFECNEYVCCAVRFLPKAAFYADMQDVGRMQVFERVTQILRNLFSQWENAYIIEQADHQYFLFWGLNAQASESQMRQTLSQIRQMFSRKDGYMSIHVGIGTRKAHMEELAESYSQALLALNCCDKEDSFAICCADDVATQESEKRSRQIAALMDAVVEGQVTEAMILLNDLINRSSGNVEQLAKDVYAAFSGRLAAIGANVDALSPPAMGASEASLRKELEGFIAQVEQLLSHMRREPHAPSVVAKTIEQIHAHFSEDLHIEGIAAQMGISARSLSQKFREEMEVSIVDYINQVRIDYVKGALVHTDKQISTISEEAGFFSRSTFIRTFKQITGMTPSKYREVFGKHGKENE